MAGSYKHCITDDGKLRRESFLDLIENLGDAYEVIQEMYGMIWYIAENDFGVRNGLTTKSQVVEHAQRMSAMGIEISPGVEDG